MMPAVAPVAGPPVDPRLGEGTVAEAVPAVVPMDVAAAALKATAVAVGRAAAAASKVHHVVASSVACKE